MHTQPSLWPWVSPDTGPELPFTKFECFPWCCAGQTYRQRHWGPRPALTPPSAQSQGHRGRLSALGSKGKPRPQGAGAGQRPPFPDLHPGGKGQPCSVRQALPLLEGTAVPTPPEPSPAAGGTPSLPCLSPFLSPQHSLRGQQCASVSVSPLRGGADARHQEHLPRPATRPTQQHSPVRLPGCEVGQVLGRAETGVGKRASPKGSQKMGAEEGKWEKGEEEGREKERREVGRRKKTRRKGGERRVGGEREERSPRHSPLPR